MLAGLLFAAATSVGHDASAAVRAGSSLAGQKLEVIGPWSGAEEKSFRAVIDRFEQETGADVDLHVGRRRPCADTRGAGRSRATRPTSPCSPSPACWPSSPRRARSSRSNDAAGATVDANYASIWRTLGSVDGTLYGVWFKAADKSLWWYDARVFDRVGVTPPATLRGLLNAARRIARRRRHAVVGRRSRWLDADRPVREPLPRDGGTEEVRPARGPSRSAWTDPSVTAALRAMGELLQPQLVAGGPEGALRTDFKTSVRQVFATPPAAAMVMEGDFVAGVIASETNAKVGRRAKVFPYPAATAKSAKPLIVGGDAAVLMRDSEAGRALIEFLATPDGGGRVGRARRLHLAQPERRTAPVPRPGDALDRTSGDQRARRSALRPLRPPARRVRGDGGIRALAGLPGLPCEPG